MIYRGEPLTAPRAVHWDRRRPLPRYAEGFPAAFAALQQAREAGEEGVAAVEREVGMARLADALPVIDAAAGAALAARIALVAAED